jgi:hypothetical protein
LAIGIAASDLALKLMARVGSCPGEAPAIELWTELWSAPQGCEASAMAGPSIALQSELRSGALFDLASGHFGQVHGQLYALALMSIATVISIFVLRWRYHTTGDAALLLCLWSGALLEAFPRFIHRGLGLAELNIFGAAIGIPDIAFTWALGWFGARLIRELIA